MPTLELEQIEKNLQGKEKVKRTIFNHVTDDILLALSGKYSTYKIAGAIGISQHAVWSRLKTLQIKEQGMSHFKSHKADYLAHQQYRETRLQERILEELESKDKIATLTIAEKRSWYYTLGISKGTNYDKERLERGMSTQNIDFHAIVTAYDGVKARRQELETEVKRLQADTKGKQDGNNSTSIPNRDSHGIPDVVVDGDK